MGTTVTGWTTLAEQPLVLLREYGFGPGKANALAVRLPNGKLLLISPPVGVPDAELKALATQGEVTALVASNGAHHLGLAPCGKAFPGAVSYATATARARILKKAKGAGRLEPIESLQPQLGDGISLVAADGCKTGDVILRVQTERGLLLYAGDFFANIATLPKNPLFRMLFKLTDSGPGFKVFRIFFKFFASDPRALRDFLVRELEARPPVILAPAHGDVVTRPDLGPTLISMLRKAIP
jgi:glyoxylase-like metal-dependent hydrolase (beta-lactamase superfamily II)